MANNPFTAVAPEAMNSLALTLNKYKLWITIAAWIVAFHCLIFGLAFLMALLMAVVALLMGSLFKSTATFLIVFITLVTYGSIAFYCFYFAKNAFKKVKLIREYCSFSKEADLLKIFEVQSKLFRFTGWSVIASFIGSTRIPFLAMIFTMLGLL